MRLLLSCLLGAVAGGVCGALLLGVPTYLDTGSGFLGPNRDWAPVAAIMGLILGGIPGACIGLLAGLTRVGKGGAAAFGAGVGAAVLVILCALGLDPLLDRELVVIGLLCVPVGALVGLVASAATRRARKPDEAGVP